MSGEVMVINEGHTVPAFGVYDGTMGGCGGMWPPFEPAPVPHECYSNIVVTFPCSCAHAEANGRLTERLRQAEQELLELTEGSVFTALLSLLLRRLRARRA